MSLPRSLQEVLKGVQGLAGLLGAARQNERYQQLVNNRLSAPLKEHCQVATLRDGVLVLLADSPVWAARLRFEAPALLKQLEAEPALCGLKTIQVRVSG